MPAMHLVSTVLPAPLSPTSAMTSPDRARKSTPRSACTAPKRLCTPRTSSSGVSLTSARFPFPRLERRGAARTPPPPDGRPLLDPCGSAVLLVLALADVAGLQEAVLDDRVLDVVLGH